MTEKLLKQIEDIIKEYGTPEHKAKKIRDLIIDQLPRVSEIEQELFKNQHPYIPYSIRFTRDLIKEKLEK